VNRRSSQVKETARQLIEQLPDDATWDELLQALRHQMGAEIEDTEVAILSEAALAEDWNRPEEDRAWSHLQPGR
jgi:hypothetical protein